MKNGLFMTEEERKEITGDKTDGVASESNVERIVMRFLEMKAQLQGAEAANKTEITYIGDDMYDLILPCKDGVFHCGLVSINNIEQMTKDMINILGV
jgi:hypothetical protein